MGRSMWYNTPVKRNSEVRYMEPDYKKHPMARYLNERLTSNRDINKCAWCKSCIFRDKAGDLGPQKCFCGVYTMENPKPSAIVFDNIRCDFYERDPDYCDD